MYNSWDFYGVEITNPIYDSIWNLNQKSYKSIKVNVTCNTKVKENDVQSQNSESTETNDRNNKQK